jgi:hypothetical protein
MDILPFKESAASGLFLPHTPYIIRISSARQGREKENLIAVLKFRRQVLCPSDIASVDNDVDPFTELSFGIEGLLSETVMPFRKNVKQIHDGPSLCQHDLCSGAQNGPKIGKGANNDRDIIHRQNPYC